MTEFRECGCEGISFDFHPIVERTLHSLCCSLISVCCIYFNFGVFVDQGFRPFCVGVRTQFCRIRCIYFHLGVFVDRGFRRIYIYLGVFVDHGFRRIYLNLGVFVGVDPGCVNFLTLLTFRSGFRPLTIRKGLTLIGSGLIFSLKRVGVHLGFLSLTIRQSLTFI